MEEKERFLFQSLHRAWRLLRAFQWGAALQQGLGLPGTAPSRPAHQHPLGTEAGTWSENWRWDLALDVSTLGLQVSLVGGGGRTCIPTARTPCTCPALSLHAWPGSGLAFSSQDTACVPALPLVGLEKMPSTAHLTDQCQDIPSFQLKRNTVLRNFQGWTAFCLFLSTCFSHR